MIIKVATDDGSAYYEIVSRLKKTHLKFSSVSPASLSGPGRGLILTSRREVGLFQDAVAIEDLHEEPLIMEGQILSHFLEESKRGLVVGIDPGKRIGVAVFYGGKEIGSTTANSVTKVVDLVVAAVRDIPHSALSVKIGGGEPRSSSRLARLLRTALGESSSIEIVDESGTSANKRGAAGGTRDQRAAERIAFRKGVRFSSGAP